MATDPPDAPFSRKGERPSLDSIRSTWAVSGVDPARADVCHHIRQWPDDGERVVHKFNVGFRPSQACWWVPFLKSFSKALYEAFFPAAAATDMPTPCCGVYIAVLRVVSMFLTAPFLKCLVSIIVQGGLAEQTSGGSSQLRAIVLWTDAYIRHCAFLLCTLDTPFFDNERCWEGAVRPSHTFLYDGHGLPNSTRVFRPRSFPPCSCALLFSHHFSLLFSFLFSSCLLFKQHSPPQIFSYPALLSCHQHPYINYAGFPSLFPPSSHQSLFSSNHADHASSGICGSRGQYSHLASYAPGLSSS